MPAKKSFAAICAFAARAFGNDRGVKRRRDQAPFRRRVGMREAAAKRAAHADRVMRDVPRDTREQLPERIVDDRLVKSCVTHARADGQQSFRPDELVEAGNLVDVDEMGRPRHAEGHDRHEALPAGQNAAVLRRDLGQNPQRLFERLRHMADEGRGFHAAKLPGMARRIYLYANDKACARFVKQRLSRGLRCRLSTPLPAPATRRRWRAPRFAGARIFRRNVLDRHRETRGVGINGDACEYSA